MNYSAHASLLLGKNAITPQRIRSFRDLYDEEDLEEMDFSLEDGYILIRFFTPREGEVWDAAHIFRGFAIEEGPDSGGPGVAGTHTQQLDLYPHNLPLLCQLYEDWKKETPPVSQEDFQHFLRLLREVPEEDLEEVDP